MKTTTRIMATAFALCSLHVEAAIFQCKVDGKTVFSDKPCGQSAVDITKKIESNAKTTVTPEDAPNTWHFLRYKDEMTGVETCIATSPKLSPGFINGKLYISQLRIGGTWENPVILIHSETDLDGRANSFHTDIDDLGLKVGENPFVTVDIKSGSYGLGFGPEKSRKLVQQLKTDSPYRARLRYWPYETIYDTLPRKHSGFENIFQQVAECGELVAERPNPR